MYALIFGCTAPLVPGELVLGEDIPAVFEYGTEDSRYGASVAWREEHLLVGAPGARKSWLDGELLEGPYEWLAWFGEQRVQADGQYLWVNGAWVADFPHAVAMAASEEALVVATRKGLQRMDQPWNVPVEGIISLALGESRVLAVVCNPDCEGHAWSLSGDDLGKVTEAGERGGIAEWEGMAWGGDPQWRVDEDPGRVCNEAGECLEGMPGDHLGATIAGGYTAGMFNKRITPPRLRIVPLGEGPVYVMETGAEQQEVTLGGDVTTLVVGAPYLPHDETPSGAVVRVRR